MQYSDVKQVLCLEAETCSHIAAKKFIHTHFSSSLPPKFIHVPSFWDGSEMLRSTSDQATILLMPVVHELTPKLIVDPDFQLMHEWSMWIPNPPLYLAERNVADNITGGSESCATIAALVPLLGQLSSLTIQNVGTTQEAARLAQSGIVQYCITNESGVQRYELKIVRQLKHMNMLWLPLRFIRD